MKINLNIKFHSEHTHTGSDESSQAFTAMINTDAIRKELESEDFVAIKVQSDSEAYMQFAQICKVSIKFYAHKFACLFWVGQGHTIPFFNTLTNHVKLFPLLFADKLVPLPSLFFIGKNGTPIEIVTAVTKTVDELKSKIDKVLDRTPPATASTAAAASANLISSKTNIIQAWIFRLN